MISQLQVRLYLINSQDNRAKLDEHVIWLCELNIPIFFFLRLCFEEKCSRLRMIDLKLIYLFIYLVLIGRDSVKLDIALVKYWWAQY